MDSNRQFRDSLARDYFHSTSARGVANGASGLDASVSGLRRRLRPWLDVRGKTVLDLGCGTGELCRLLQDEGAMKVTGVNLSAEEIDYAQRHCSAEFICAEIGDYLDTIAPESVDRIFALNILEHLSKEQLAHVLRGALRVLRRGGNLVAMVPNATSPFGGMTRYWDITHENAFTPSSVVQLATFIGFSERVDFRECGPVAHGLVSLVRFVLWQGIRLGIKFRLLVELASTKGGIYTADMMFCLRKS